MDGNIVSIAGIDQDITDKMLYKIAHENTEKKYQILVDSITSGILIIDKNGIIKYFNNYFEKLSEYKFDELINKNINILFNESNILINEINECIMNTKNGIQKYVYITNSNYNEDLLIVITDITEKKNFEKELIEKNKMLEQFAYITAHDMKTPLRSIVGFVEKIYREIDKNDFENEKIIKYKGYINKSIKQMDETIQDSLTYGKLYKVLSIEKDINIKECINIAVLSIDNLINENN